MEELIYLARLAITFVPLVALALLVKHERKIRRWAGRKPRRRRHPGIPKGIVVR